MFFQLLSIFYRIALLLIFKLDKCPKVIKHLSGANESFMCGQGFSEESRTVYHIVKTKYQVDRARLPGLFAALTARWPEAKGDRLDGLRLDWPNRWVHVRPSNTEPIIRVIAEAPLLSDAKLLCDQVAEML